MDKWRPLTIRNSLILLSLSLRWGRFGLGVIARWCRQPKVTPTSRGKIDFCEEQKSSRVVLPHQGGGCDRTGSAISLAGRFTWTFRRNDWLVARMLWLMPFGFLLAAITTFPATAQTRRSATEFLSPDLQAQQADDGANPGMLWVSQGAALWSAPPAAAVKSCASCHGDAAASMTGVATRYPQVDDKSGQLLNLEGRINQCRTTHQGQPAYTYETDDLLGLTAFVAHQSRGQSFAVKIDGTAAPFYEAGKAFYFERQGQLNVSCAQCHDAQVGGRLRGDTISSGLTGAYPAYRLDWQKAGSLHRRLRACSLGVRAIQLPAGSPEYLALELYLNGRGAGTRIETPGIRK
jgi:L-cysteine S-thiosulfotransferase